MDILLLLDRHAGLPVYRQIVDQVRFQVASCVLPTGAELPSTRALAAAHGLNPMTVSKAYAELEREGVLVRRPGLPHVVAARADADLATDREGELARALEPAVAAVRQLGLDPELAVALFARLLHESIAGPGADGTSPPGPGAPDHDTHDE